MTEGDIRNFIRTFSFDKCPLGNQGFQRVFLQLFGYFSQDRSSFINTCKMVWENSQYKDHVTSPTSQEDFAMSRVTYPLTESLILVDNRASENAEILAQLANLLPLDKPAGKTRGQGLNLAERIVEGEPLVASSDLIFPIFVFSMKSLKPEEINRLKETLSICKKMTGVFPIIILTHKKKGSHKEMENMFQNIGAEKVYSLENYTAENCKKSEETHQEVIRFLYEAVKIVIFQMKKPRDPKAEMMERKVFVLNYIHHREVEAHKRNLEQQTQVEKAGIEQAMRLKMLEAEKDRQKERQLHEQELRRLEEEFNRKRLQDQLEHESRLQSLQKKKSKNVLHRK